jgi:hypothetical protein
MELTAQVFKSFEEADRADALFRSRLTPHRRVEMFFELQERALNNADEPRFERVYRVLELEQS